MLFNELFFVLYVVLLFIFISCFYYIWTILWVNCSTIVWFELKTSLLKIGIYCICILFYISIWTEVPLTTLYIISTNCFYYILTSAWVVETIWFWFINCSSLWTIERYFFLTTFLIWAYAYGTTWVWLLCYPLNHWSFFLFTIFWFKFWLMILFVFDLNVVLLFELHLYLEFLLYFI